MRRALVTVHLLPFVGASALEPEVLERFRSMAVQPGRFGIVAATGRKIPLGDPDGSTVARGLELLERALRFGELRFSLGEAALLEKRAAEHELRVADLVDPVLTVSQKRQRMTRLLLGRRDLTETQLHLSERRHGSG